VGKKLEAMLKTFYHCHPSFIMAFKLMNFTKYHLNFWLSRMSSGFTAVPLVTVCILSWEHAQSPTPNYLPLVPNPTGYAAHAAASTHEWDLPGVTLALFCV
jgi:hypothetical protein